MEKDVNNKNKEEPIDQVEEDFLLAFERVKSGTVRHSSLCGKLLQGKLKVTIANVALEAGRSRTLIGMDGCRYPEIRNKILAAKGKKIEERSERQDEIDTLKQKNTELQKMIQAYQAETTIHFNARRAAELAQQKAEMQIANLKQMAKENGIILFEDRKTE